MPITCISTLDTLVQSLSYWAKLVTNMAAVDNAKVIWVVRGGSQGELDTMFLKDDVVAVGWPAMGDVTKLEKTRDAYKAAVTKGYPDSTPGSIPGSAGQVFRFVVEMQIGDIVMYPSKIDRHIHIGQITGDPVYNPSKNAIYPNMRAVKWLRKCSRTQFSQGALAESNSILTVFQVRNYADEFRAALAGETTPIESSDDPTVAEAAETTTETTRDFILKRLARELKGYPLQDFVAHLLVTMGYRTRVQQKGSDGGVDIIAHKDELGLEPPIIKVQVKGTEGSSGDPEVSSLYGKVSPSEFGLFVTLGTFTPKARQFAQSKHNLRLVDGDELVSLILDHYEDFNSKYKGLIPLARVYVPERVG